MKLTMHIYLVARIEMSGNVPLSPHKITPSWRARGELSFLFVALFMDCL